MDEDKRLLDAKFNINNMTRHAGRLRGLHTVKHILKEIIPDFLEDAESLEQVKGLNKSIDALIEKHETLLYDEEGQVLTIIKDLIDSDTSDL